jgi:hypothetical protein
MLRKIIARWSSTALVSGMALAPWLLGSSPAAAANCPSFTYTLTNGTTADA